MVLLICFYMVVICSCMFFTWFGNWCASLCFCVVGRLLVVLSFSVRVPLLASSPSLGSAAVLQPSAQGPVAQQQAVAEAQRASIAEEAHRKRSECYPRTVLLVFSPPLRALLIVLTLRPGDPSLHGEAPSPEDLSKADQRWHMIFIDVHSRGGSAVLIRPSPSSSVASTHHPEVQGKHSSDRRTISFSAPPPLRLYC